VPTDNAQAAVAQTAIVPTDIRCIDLAGLGALIALLHGQGYEVIGPVVTDGAIGYGPIEDVADLPRGWGDEQAPGHYRLVARDDEAVLAQAAGAASVKPFLFPAEQLLWRSRATPDGPQVEPCPPGTDDGRPAGPYAMLVRPCDLRAIAVHDTVLLRRTAQDVHYAARRADCLLVALTCTDPAATCFCTSMGTGPAPDEHAGQDLTLTELYQDGPHRFLLSAVSARGADLIDTLDPPPATAADLAAAERAVEQAITRIRRTLPAGEVKDLLYAQTDSPHWEQVAARCLSCTNCTLVCPTCFCTTITDTTQLSGDAARHRVWDSCFSLGHSYLHGGSVRESVRSRYRQWITHKLASWQDQFGSSGCVGCGRCITWCPAGIDLVAEVAVLRETSPTPSGHHR
jgi:ferredoxin